MQPQLNVLPIEKDIWHSNLQEFSHSIFMLPQWLGVVETAKRIPIFFDFIKNNQIVAKASGLIIKDNQIKGKQLFFYAGPALRKDDAELYNQCLNSLRFYAQINGFSRIQIFYFDNRILHRPNVSYYHSYPMNEAVINLQSDYKQFKPGSSLRKKRNTAIRVQTTIFESKDEKMIKRLCELTENTRIRRMKRHNSDYHKLSFPYFNEEHVPKLLKSGIANMYCSMNPDGTTHFIALVIEHNKSVYGLFNGCDDYGYQFGLPGYTILKNSIEYQEKGFERFNLGGVPASRNEKGKLLQFKEEIGGITQTIYVAKTDFLIYPFKAFNPLINIARKLPYNRVSRILTRLLRY